jgi:protein-S-isoprenylcysteine O-methyltransferase Ste14
MRIHRWHWGKVVILWAWGGVIAALLLAVFISTPILENPALATIAFVGCLVLLIALSAVTWVWLTGKEKSPPQPKAHASGV